MAFQIISSEIVTYGTGTDPAPVNITPPANCNAVVIMWSYLHFTGAGVSTMTLDSNSFNESFEGTWASGNRNGGVHVFHSPATGSAISLDVTWDTAPQEGPTVTAVYIEDYDQTGYRDADGANTAGAAACSVTLTTVSGDIVIKHDSNDTDLGIPALSSGWADLENGNGPQSEDYRTSTITATGSTEVCDSETESYSQIIAIAIKDGSGGGSPIVIEVLPGGTPY